MAKKWFAVFQVSFSVPLGEATQRSWEKWSRTRKWTGRGCRQGGAKGALAPRPTPPHVLNKILLTPMG